MHPEPAVFCAGVIDTALRRSRDGVLLNLRVSPGARKTFLDGLYGETSLKAKVAAPPVDGKANAEIERFLSELLGLPCFRVEIVKGAAGRDKVARMQGIELEEAQEKLTLSEG
ncbi:DUF167 domain-containing protein [soil metagenome]